MKQQEIQRNDMKYPEGLKWTKQRKEVYRILYMATEPLTAVQIFNRLENEEYALSTVYRIMSAFETQNLVIKSTMMGDGTVLYELNRGEHTHFAVCLDCHKRIPLDHCPVAHLHLEEETENFTITSHKLELYGYCKDCKKQK